MTSTAERASPLARSGAHVSSLAAAVEMRAVHDGNDGEAMRRLPGIAVITAIFPSQAQPVAGLFIRERMFRVGKYMPVVVVVPQPWFPLQSLIRCFRPNYRPHNAAMEIQDGQMVLFPRFFSFPGLFRWLDGVSMAVCLLPTLRRLRRERGIGVIDAHFAYPAGYAGTLLGRWLRMPVAVTLRGTEAVHLHDGRLRSRVVDAVRRADRVFSVSDALRQLLIEHGASRESIQVIGNGVDLDKFRPLDQSAARETLGLPVDAKVIVSVGGLVERKGFHRVIEVMPELLRQVPHLHYVIVGGASPAGDMSMQLRDQVRRLGLDKRVHFTGPLPPERLCVPLSAADVFVLATRYEGWANVFLEAMACGLPVVTTNVGGNAEVVASENLGILVPFGDARALVAAIRNALQVRWDREQILRYARDNTWDRRVDVLVAHFRELVARATSAG